MKSRMLLMVKRLWPLAAFVVAACLVAGFVFAQNRVKQQESPEEARRQHHAELLEQYTHYKQEQSYNRALEALEEIIAEYPGEYDPSFDLTAAEMCLEVKPPRIDRASIHIATYLKKKPGASGTGIVSKIRGEEAYARGDYAGALAYLRKFHDGRAEAAEDYHVLALMARCYYEAHDNANAQKLWLKVADGSIDDRDPDEAHFYLGEINAAKYALIDQNDKDKAKYAKAALDEYRCVFNSHVNPDIRYASRIRTADILLSMGDYDNAREAYVSAVEVAPSAPDMLRLLNEGQLGDSRDELLKKQILGRTQTMTAGGAQVAPAKLQKIVWYYCHNGDGGGQERTANAIEALKRASTAFEKKQALYMQIAGLQDEIVVDLKAEIKALEKSLAEIKRGLNDRMATEEAFRLEQQLQSKREMLDQRLKDAAYYYEFAFNDDRFQDVGASIDNHPLWRAAQRQIERRDYADAERLLAEILSPDIKLQDRAMLAEVRSCLGRLYRDMGAYADALKMFRAIIEDSPALRQVGAEFEVGVTLSLMGDDAGAEKIFEDLTRDDNTTSDMDRTSKIWRESTFELGKLRYRQAIAAKGVERVEKLSGVVDFLTEAMDRYAAFLNDDPAMRNLLLYYISDSLHHLALEAISRGENQKARELFQQARAHLSQTTVLEELPEEMPVAYRNGRLLVALTLDFESRAAADDAQKQALGKRAVEAYESASKELEGTEQGIWACIQLGLLADASTDAAFKARARRYYELAESGIRKLQGSRAFEGNPRGFDAAYIQEVLKWLRGRTNQG